VNPVDPVSGAVFPNGIIPQNRWSPDNVGAWNDHNGSLYPQDAYNLANENALAENIVKFNSVASWVTSCRSATGGR
jgi:hypothetical protein